MRGAGALISAGFKAGIGCPLTISAGIGAPLRVEPIPGASFAGSAEPDDDADEALVSEVCEEPPAVRVPVAPPAVVFAVGEIAFALGLAEGAAGVCAVDAAGALGAAATLPGSVFVGAATAGGLETIGAPGSLPPEDAGVTGSGGSSS